MSGFSPARVLAMLVKEFRQMMRGTPSVLLMMPIMQLLLFGYAINDNPHHLPTGVFVQDQGEFARSILAAMHNTGYFDIVATARSSAELDRLMALGEIDFSVTIPGDFTRRVVRHDNAQILVEDEHAGDERIEKLGALDVQLPELEFSGHRAAPHCTNPGPRGCLRPPRLRRLVLRRQRGRLPHVEGDGVRTLGLRAGPVGDRGHQ